MFTPKKLTLAILSACLIPAANAAELAPVDVTATAEESQQTTTDTQTLLESGNSETGTTLRKVAGVEASRMGGHGVDLVIRGQKESQLNIIIDGAKIEGGCPNRMDPPSAYAELSSFDEVTIIKGVNSVTNGTGGTGGTVLFERNAPTFEEGKPYNGEINMGTTSNGVTKDINATVSAGGDKGYIVLQGAKKSADNYEDGNGDEVNSSYGSQQGHIDLGWTPDENNELRVSLENTLTEDALFQGAAMDAPESDGTTARLRYKGKKLADNIQDVEVDIYSSEVDHLMDNYTLRDAPADKSKWMENSTNVVTEGAKLKASSMFGHTRLDYGVQYEGIDKMSTLSNATSGNSMWYMWPGVETDTKSVFAESTSFFKDNQKVILGLRYDHFTADATKADLASDTNKTALSQYERYADFDGDTSVDESNINGLIRYEKTLNNGMNVFTGVSRTHRYPDATELYIAKGGAIDANKDSVNDTDVSWIGNPDLKPEQHNQLDIGISGSNKKTNWSVSAYYDAVNDYILRDITPSANQTDLMTSKLLDGSTIDKRVIYTNIDATIYGLEATGDWNVTNKIDVGANVNFSKGTNDTDNRNLGNISPVSGSVYAQYNESNWDAGARWNFAKDQTDVNEEYGELETAGWSTLDMFANYQVNKSVRLSAGVDNVFDRAYESYLNRVDVTSGNTFKVYEPGRVAWVKLNAKF